MKTFIEYMNDSRPPRTPEEKAETEGLAKLFEEIGLEGDDLIRKRAREHPTFLLRCHWKNHHELESFKRFPEMYGGILDFGCGTGHLTIELNEAGYLVDGYDPLESAIRVARHVAQSSTENCVFHQTLPRFTFDCVWLSHVVEHIEDPTELFKEVKWCLEREGHVLISVPLRDAFPDPDHKHRWENEAEFVAYLSKWLKVIRSEEHTESGCLRALCQFKD